MYNIPPTVTIQQNFNLAEYWQLVQEAQFTLQIFIDVKIT